MRSSAAQHHLLATIYCVRGALWRLLTQLESRDNPSHVDGALWRLLTQFELRDRPSRVEGAPRDKDEKSVSESLVVRVREVWVLGPHQGLTVPFDVRTMARLLAALPHLHTLHLERVSLVPPLEAEYAGGAQRAEEPHAPRRYKLRRLDLPLVYQADTRRLTAMLGLCAEVQELTLGCVAEAVDGDYDVEDADERTRCQSLVIDGRYPVSLQVRRALRLDVLKKCEIKFPWPKHIPSVLEILCEAAGSLESLTLHLYPRSPAYGASYFNIWLTCNV